MRERYEVAIDLAQTAGTLAASAFASFPGGGGTKFAHETNQQVERVLVATLRNRFARDAVFGEEFGTPIGDPLWVIDPIDGLFNFGNGVPYFCVSIAVVTDGQPCIGVVYDPLNDDLFVARANQGAERNGTRIMCRAPRPLRESCIGVGFAPRTNSSAYLSIVQRLAAAGVEHRNLGAAALTLAHVADGRLDGFYEPHLHSWDALAGLLIAREAGTTTNDFLCGQWLSRGNYVLAAVPSLWNTLHDMVLNRSARDAA